MNIEDLKCCGNCWYITSRDSHQYRCKLDEKAIDPWMLCGKWRKDPFRNAGRKYEDEK